MTGLFDHCRGDRQQAWSTLYQLACLCHPAQGGSRADMAAVCAQARDALGDAWPAEWADGTLPALFDLFCLSTNVPNPFGKTITPEGPESEEATSAPQGYEASGQLYASAES